MPARRWVLIAFAVLAVLAAAFLATGGVYRTVNVGGGRMYVVNRFTGSTRDIWQGEEHEVTPRPRPKPPLQEVDIAIALTKNNQTGFVTGASSNHDWIRGELAEAERAGIVKVGGWHAEPFASSSYWDKDTYLVGFTYQVVSGRESEHARWNLRALTLAARGAAFPKYGDDRRWWGLCRRDSDYGWYWLTDASRREVNPITLPRKVSTLPASSEEWERDLEMDLQAAYKRDAQNLSRHGIALSPALPEIAEKGTGLLSIDERERALAALRWIGVR